MKNKKDKILIILAIIFPIILGGSYTYYLAVIKNNTTEITGSNNNKFNISLETTNDGYIEVNNIAPGKETKKLSFRVISGDNKNNVRYSLKITNIEVSDGLKKSNTKWTLICTNDSSKNASGTFESFSGKTLKLIDSLTIKPNFNDQFEFRLAVPKEINSNTSFKGKVTIEGTMLIKP